MKNWQTRWDGIRHQIRDISGDKKAGICSVCGPTAIYVAPSSGQAICIVRRRARGRGHTRRGSKHGYRITRAEFAGLREAQQGLCAICGLPMQPQYVDHDHVTGRIRGLLCRGCNTGLGHFRDSPELLESAAVYLRR